MKRPEREGWAGPSPPSAHIYALRRRASQTNYYVGHTTLPTLQPRWPRHLQCCRGGGPRPLYKWMRQVGIDNVEMVLLETCAFEDKKAREIWWWEKSPGLLN